MLKNKKTIEPRTVYIMVFFASVLSGGSAGVIIFSISENLPKSLLWLVPMFSVAFLFVVSWMLWKYIKRLERLKSSFIAVAAHRLRTPMTRIDWSLASMDETVESPKNKELIAIVRETISELVALTNQLLDASESGNISLFDNYMFENISFSNIARKAILRYSVGIGDRNIKLSAEIEEELPSLHVDKERMGEAIGVLIENAIMYTKKGGEIKIRVKSGDKKVMFSIEDTGIGIDSESMRYMFSKFFRTKEAIRMETDHSGLGLYLAQGIIKRHGGVIKVESKGKGEGSRFWFELPIVISK